MGKPFVSLHTHSFYSILEASATPKSLIQKAKELGCDALAITDTGAGYGLIDFYEVAVAEGGVKPILGAEIFVAKDSRFEKRAGIDGREGNVVLLAQNEVGYKNLLKIISIGELEGFYYKPRVDWETLEQHHAGLVALTGSTSGLLGREVRDGMPDRAKEYFGKLQSIFGKEQVYLEVVSRHFEQQVELNKWVVRLAKETGSPMVLTSEARYANPEDEEACDVLFCIGKNQNVSDPNRMKFAEQNWLKSYEEMVAEMSYIPEEVLNEARKNTLKIAAGVDLKIEFGKYKIPYIELEEGKTAKDTLREACEGAIVGRYGKKTPEIQERLEYELGVIGSMGFEEYFLIVADFIRFAKENGIAVGPGRGSAAGSIVSYLLNITSIDPLRYELLFERFLNPERISMPDIDIDFSDERRDEVLQYVTEKYGVDRVSRVCTFGTLAAKAAMKDVGRAYGIPFAEMNAMTKVVPNRPGITLDDIEKMKDFQNYVGGKPHLQKVVEIAHKLEGCVRHVSVHACAVIIGRDELSNHTPVQWAPGAEEIKITQYPYQQLEHLGLLKMDFLGLKNLSVLEKAIANVKATTGKEIVLEALPIDDAKTFQMMSEAETTGVFQFESSGMRRYLRELKPTEFEDLVAMNALYRPGPMEYIPEYIKGKHKPEGVEYMHDSLKSILEKTYGIAVYQEQVLKIAQVFAGYSLGEADILRKAIGKKIASILAQQRKRFIDGAVEKGNNKKMAEKIFDEIIVPFSGYGFNRSHAVCYARIAYETAYMRANFPVEFMAAMMTTDRNNTDRIVLEMNECAAMGIEVLPPSINESGSSFTIVSGDRAQTTLGKEEEQKTIRFGLTAIKGIGEETVNQMIFERQKNGKFASLQDFAKRVPAKVMNKKTLEALAYSGALDQFGDRGAVVDSLDDLARFSKEYQEKQSAGQIGLFGGTDESSIEFALRDGKATKEDILRWEREILGLFVSDHPLKGMGAYFEKYGRLIGKLSESEDVGKKRTFHGLVVGVRRLVTKKGKNMAILQLEDTSGKVELAVFPGVYESIPQAALEEDCFVRVRGKVEDREGAFAVIVDDIKVGDLSKIQVDGGGEVPVFNGAGKASGLLEKEGNRTFVIQIPAGTTRGKIDALKQILTQGKSEDIEAMAVQVILDGKTADIPFGVKMSDKLREEVKRALQ